MKKAIILLGLICCMAGSSCYPDKCCYIPPRPENSIVAIRNDFAWSVFNPLVKITLDTITISDNFADIVHSEMIAFKLKFRGTDNYTLLPANVIYEFAPATNVSALNYTLDPGFNNSFSVTNYDTSTGLITGMFNIRLNKDAANTDTRYPATISFLDGTFNIHLSK